MKNFIYKRVSIQNIRMITRWMTIVLFGLFFLLLVMTIVNKGLDINQIDIILSLSMLIYVVGIGLSYRKELLSGYILTLSSLLYVIIQTVFESSLFMDIQGFYLLVPSMITIMIGYFQQEDYLKSIEIERLKIEISDINQSYVLSKSMLEIVPDMIRNDDLDFILQRVLEKTIESIPKAQAGSIILKIGQNMEFRAAVGYDLNLLRKLNLKFEDILQYKLGAIHDPVIINDVETYNVEDVYHHLSSEDSNEDQIISKAMMTHVIMHKRDIFGFINIDNLEDPKAFSSRDKNVIKRVTKHIEMIIENQSLIENVYKMSRYDALTGAFTRRYYLQQINDLYNLSKANSSSFSIITFDLDDLKQKNDIHGHEAGDLYLLNFADLVRDLMPKQAFLSRVGGDEFVLVIPNSNNEIALEFVQRVLDQCHTNPFTFNHINLNYMFSFGISSFPNDSEELDMLIRLSDQRMYENKRKKEIK